MTRWTLTSESPSPTGRSTRVREAEIGSSSAKMSSISSRRERREVGSLPDLAGLALELLVGAFDVEVLLVLGAVVVVFGQPEVDQRSVPCVA